MKGRERKGGLGGRERGEREKLDLDRENERKYQRRLVTVFN